MIKTFAIHWKPIIKGIPIIGTILTRLFRLIRPVGFRSSKEYWEERYFLGGNSGSGSFGRLARLKAEILNQFIKEHNILSIIEFGVGDGNQLSLGEYPKYFGIDVSQTAIRICSERFKEDRFKSFMLYKTWERKRIKADLAISLDVIYHLVEDRVFEKYMFDLFSSAERFVIVYSSNIEEEQRHHVRMRHFTSWVFLHIKEWILLKRIKNRYPFDSTNPENTSPSDFYIFERLKS